MLGPVSGGLLAASFGISYVFISAGVLFLLTAAVLKWLLSQEQKKEEQETVNEQ